MKFNLIPLQTPDGKPALGVQVSDQAILEPRKVCQFLKQNFPDAYREVWYEITVPTHANGSRLTED